VAVFHQYKYNWRRLNGDSTEYWNCRDKSENGVPSGATITTKFDQVNRAFNSVFISIKNCINQSIYTDSDCTKAKIYGF
jgi:hypothetical protein